MANVRITDMGFRRGLQEAPKTQMKYGAKCTTVGQMRSNEINGLQWRCTTADLTSVRGLPRGTLRMRLTETPDVAES